MAFSVKLQLFLITHLLFLEAGCISNPQKENKSDAKLIKETQPTSHNFQKRKVPVLCYHALRNIRVNDTPNQKTYSVSPDNFALQIKALADNGYVSITPGQLLDNWTKGTPLPKKPIIITFDDGRKEQYSIGAKILDQYHFKGVFFIMTVTIGKPRYLNREEIKSLSDEGHIIGCHTWDHHKVTDYKKEDWKPQLVNSRTTLQNITGRAVTSFAYPYGVWTHATADSLKNNGYSNAFIVYGNQDQTQALYTIRRIIVPNTARVKDFLHMIETY